MIMHKILSAKCEWYTSKDENWVIIKIYLRVLKIFSRVFLCSSLNFEGIFNYRPERKIRGMCLMSNY